MPLPPEHIERLREHFESMKERSPSLYNVTMRNWHNPSTRESTLRGLGIDRRLYDEQYGYDGAGGDGAGDGAGAEPPQPTYAKGPLEWQTSITGRRQAMVPGLRVEPEAGGAGALPPPEDPARGDPAVALPYGPIVPTETRFLEMWRQDGGAVNPWLGRGRPGEPLDRRPPPLPPPTVRQSPVEDTSGGYWGPGIPRRPPPPRPPDENRSTPRFGFGEEQWLNPNQNRVTPPRFAPSRGPMSMSARWPGIPQSPATGGRGGAGVSTPRTQQTAALPMPSAINLPRGRRRRPF